MPFPKLSPLQSRLAASLFASVAVLILYLALSSSNLAYALHPDSISLEDHNNERLLTPYILEGELDEDIRYEAEFYGAERSIIGRVDPDITPLPNNHFD